MPDLYNIVDAHRMHLMGSHWRPLSQYNLIMMDSVQPGLKSAGCAAELTQGAARDAEAIQVLLGHRGGHSQHQALDRCHAGWLHSGVRLQLKL